MLEIAGLAVAGVTALSAVVQAYYAARSANGKVSDATLRKAEKRANEPLKTGVKRVAEVIDTELLETLQQEIETQNRNLIEAFRVSGISDEERQRRVESARIEICRFLTEVKRFNADSLPTKRLEQLWISNECKS